MGRHMKEKSTVLRNVDWVSIAMQMATNSEDIGGTIRNREKASFGVQTEKAIADTGETTNF